MMNIPYRNQLEQSKVFISSLPWDKRDFYANYLAQTYYFVCHSTRLLAKAISYFGVDRDRLYRRFTSHLVEEGHHEKLAERDIRNLSCDMRDFPELSTTKAFYESQYYKVEVTKGTGLLGYILYLEAISVYIYPEITYKLRQYYGDKCCKFLKIHTEEDPGHVEKAIEEIHHLAPREQEEIWGNFIQTADLYHHILGEVRKDNMSYYRAA